MGLRVGLDGKPLLPPRAGVFRYTHGLLAGLAKVAGAEVELHVIAPKKFRRTAPWVLWHLQWATYRGFQVFHFPFYYPPLFPGCPVTVAVHDVLVLSHPHWFPRAWSNTLRWLLPRGARRAAAVITGSHWVAQELVERCRVSPERVRVIPYGVDRQLFAPPRAEQLAKARDLFRLQRPYLLMVGSLEPRRGLDTLLEATRQLHGLFAELEVVLVGAVRAAVPEVVRRPSWLRLLGFVEDCWLPALYAGAAAVVAPSRGEGFDLPVLEALACGAAVVASDIPVHREVFAPAVRLFAVGEASSLACELQAVLTDSALRENLQAAGQRLAAGFSWEEAARQHLNVWREVGCERLPS